MRHTAGQRLNWAWLFAGALAFVGAVALEPPPVVSAQSAPAAGGPCDLKAPGRVVAIGDIHGAYDRYVEILREAGLVDARRRWIGGNTTVVQLGDVVDRGPDSRRALDLIRQLETEAPKTGGRFLLLLGNHEVMRMTGVLRDAGPGEYKAFQTGESFDFREKVLEHFSAENEKAAKARGEKYDAKEFRKIFLEKTPLGSVEMQIAFSEVGEYGRWLREHDFMARIDDTVYMHAGLSPAYQSLGCAGVNSTAKAEVKSIGATDPGAEKSAIWGTDGPLWYRGIAGVEPQATPEEVTQILKTLGAKRIVLGHTPSASARIRMLYDGRVFVVDTGMLGGEHYPSGVPSALEIAGGVTTAIYIGKREVLTKASYSARR